MIFRFVSRVEPCLASTALQRTEDRQLIIIHDLVFRKGKHNNGGEIFELLLVYLSVCVV